MTEGEKLNLYRAFREHGVLHKCSHCGELDFCACDVRNLSTECFRCCVERIEREEQEHLAGLDKPAPKPKPEPLKNFDVADFCRL